MNRPWLLIGLAALLLPMTLCNASEDTYTSSYLGDFKLTEGPKLDFVYIAPSFNAMGAVIQVKDFTMEAPLPEDEADDDDAEDVRWEEAGKMMAEAIVTKTGPKLKGKTVSLTKDEAPYVMDGRIFEFERGSRAARFLVGFGAGSGYITFEFKVVEAASGNVVLAAKHRRLAPGVTMDLKDLINDFAKDEFPEFWEKIVKKTSK